jgi:LuxR family maltose regulon positive regulatory protein
LGQIYLYITIAIANSQLFRDEQAINAMNMALELALPDRLYLPFVETSDQLLPILRKAQLLRDNQPSLDHIITLAMEYKNNRSSASVECSMNLSQLTPRELEIAQLAASGLTNKEIGDRLYISVNTVKTQLKSIFYKLNISSRALLTQLLNQSIIK